MQTHNPVDLDVLQIVLQSLMGVSRESSVETALWEKHLLVNFAAPYLRSAIYICVGEIKLIYFSVSEGHMSGKGD